MNGDLTAYCGADCASCSDLAEGKCPGCRKTEWPEGDACLPVACCREKGISFCWECPVFPCADMREFYGESESHGRAYALMLSLRDGAGRGTGS